jgi:hypothetical protein
VLEYLDTAKSRELLAKRWLAAGPLSGFNNPRLPSSNQRLKLTGDAFLVF